MKAQLMKQKEKLQLLNRKLFSLKNSNLRGVAIEDQDITNAQHGAKLEATAEDLISNDEVDGLLRENNPILPVSDAVEDSSECIDSISPECLVTGVCAEILECRDNLKSIYCSSTNSGNVRLLQRINCQGEDPNKLEVIGGALLGIKRIKSEKVGQRFRSSVAEHQQLPCSSESTNDGVETLPHTPAGEGNLHLNPVSVGEITGQKRECKYEESTAGEIKAEELAEEKDFVEPFEETNSENIALQQSCTDSFVWPSLPESNAAKGDVAEKGWERDSNVEFQDLEECSQNSEDEGGTQDVSLLQNVSKTTKLNVDENRVIQIPEMNEGNEGRLIVDNSATISFFESNIRPCGNKKLEDTSGVFNQSNQSDVCDSNPDPHPQDQIPLGSSEEGHVEEFLPFVASLPTDQETSGNQRESVTENFEGRGKQCSDVLTPTHFSHSDVFKSAISGQDVSGFTELQENDKRKHTETTSDIREQNQRQSFLPFQMANSESEAVTKHIDVVDATRGSYFKFSGLEKNTIGILCKDEMARRSKLTAETQDFFEEMKRNRELRLKMLQVGSLASTCITNADSEIIKKELETMWKLDMRLQQLEQNTDFTIPSAGYLWSSDERKGISTALHYLSAKEGEETTEETNEVKVDLGKARHESSSK